MAGRDLITERISDSEFARLIVDIGFSFNISHSNFRKEKSEGIFCRRIGLKVGSIFRFG
jgi:hypothetical protein